MKLKDIIWEELVDRISIDEETIRNVVRATMEDMEIEYMVLNALCECLKEEIEHTVNEMIDDVVEQSIDSEIE